MFFKILFTNTVYIFWFPFLKEVSVCVFEFFYRIAQEPQISEILYLSLIHICSIQITSNRAIKTFISTYQTCLSTCQFLLKNSLESQCTINAISKLSTSNLYRLSWKKPDIGKWTVLSHMKSVWDT